MKKIIIVIILFAFGMNAMAQEKKFSLSVNGGIATPLGNFKKTDYADESSGYVKAGFTGNIYASYKLSRNWKVGLLIGTSQFGHAGLTNLSDGYKEDSGTDSTTLYSKGSTGTFNVLIGPEYSIPVSKKMAVNLRLLGGYTHATLAGFQVFYEDYTDNAMTQDKSTTGAFGFQAGAGLSYAVTPLISILLNADYFSTKPKFDITYENFIVNSGRRLTTYNEPFNSFNATLGVGIKLF